MHISQNSPQRVKCRPTTILQSLVSWLNSFRFFTTFFLGCRVTAEYPATLTTWLKNSGYAVCGINSRVARLFSFFSKNEEITCVTHTFILGIYFSLKEYIFDITCISYCVPPRGRVLRLNFAGYVPLASQSPCRSNFSHFWAILVTSIYASTLSC